MRFITSICLALALGIGLAWQSKASAGDGGKGPNVKAGEKEKDQNDGMSVLKLAGELTAWGRANQHPGALAMAAKLMSEVKVKPMDKVDRKKHEGKGDAGTKKPKVLTADTLLAEAKALCGADDKLKAQIDGIYAMGAHSRGNLSGAESYADIALAQGEDEYYFTFRGDEFAAISVNGDGSSDLDLYVYDENDNLVACDNDASDFCYVSFVPQWTGTYHVRVLNVGDVADAYTISTN